MVNVEVEAECTRASLLGRYEIGRTLGEGNFGKVKYARHLATGGHFAVKILDRSKILSLHIDDQIRREIGTLKLLKHPNVVRLHEVAASKTKIYMVLEYVNGGELFDKIAIKGKLSEHEGRRLFQQLIDGVSYCHDKGVYHRDLKPENVLVDRKGNIKISDFGLSALPQHLGNDGLLHTTCGSPNYIAPEVLQNRGYDGSLSDIWSCGVILYVMLVGYLPFDDRNLVVLYQKIFKGDCQIPKWLSPAAQDLLKRILEPNPMKRVNISGIKEHEWFQKDYVPVVPYDDDEDVLPGSVLPIKEIDEPAHEKPTHINAFQLIGMASSLDLSGFFEEEDVAQRKIRFTSTHSPRDLFDKIENVVTEMGFQVQRGQSKLKVIKSCKSSKNPKNHTSFLVCTEVFELGPSLYVVELKKSHGDPTLYRQLCERLSDELGVCKTEQIARTESGDDDLSSFDSEASLSGF
ncbi:CBL-interacting protein kinase 1 isoform X2 [Phragmites australis]|uniref:CBL-interacting protein kinase 1 isoform X2 n=1 Tax=Phragmites australis TaxID=29695 RepID=UPI002D77D3CB|nr:CBL-interacting protein kinase 1 isoform X2 [Phragmites australis]